MTAIDPSAGGNAPIDTEGTKGADIRLTYEGIPRMPALFGRQAGPRQRPDRNERYSLAGASAIVTWVAAQADRDGLSRLLPKGFEVAEPLLIVEAVSTAGLPWLAGRGYELLTVSVPVAFTEHDQRVVGRLALVTWEDCPDAIVSGREELGYNKVYADAMVREESTDGTSVRYSVGWGGTTFFELQVELSGLQPTPAPWREGPVFHYRVLPRTGDWGDLEIEQVTANTGASTLPPDSVRWSRSGTGTFSFKPSTFEALPTLVHIVNSLADIALTDVVNAGSMAIEGWNDIHDMRIVAAWTVPAPTVHRFT